MHNKSLLPLIKQHLSTLVSFDTTFDFSNKYIFVSLRGLRNQDSTVKSITICNTALPFTKTWSCPSGVPLEDRGSTVSVFNKSFCACLSLTVAADI